MNINAFVMKLGILLLSLFVLAGCGSNNSQSIPESAPVVVDPNASVAPASMAIYGGSNKTVSESGQTLTITIQAWTKSNTPAEGVILAQALESDGKNGILSPASASLVNGLATFTYTAPDNLQDEMDANNTQTSFKFYSQTSDIDPVTAYIDFVSATLGDPAVRPASLAVYGGTQKTVALNGQVLSITIQAWTKDDTPAEGSILAQALENDGKNGLLTPARVDLVNGLATFTYTAPDNLQAEIDANNTQTEFRFYSQTSDITPATVQINFDTTLVGDPTGNPIAKLEVLNGSTVINEGGAQVAVQLLAKDSFGYAVKGGVIRVKYPANAVRVGIFSADEVIVGENGIATFNYTGPDSIYYGSASFVFEYKNDTNYTATWNVSFIPIYEPVDPGEPVYPIASVASNEDIVANTDAYTKTIQVLAMMSGNVPAPAGKISVVYPADAATKNIGYFTPATADITDGIATFTYHGPTPLIGDTDQLFTFRATNYPNVSDTVKVSYVPKIDPAQPVAQTMSVVNDDDNNPANGKLIAIKQNSQVVKIKVRVFGVDNNPFNGGNVKITYPDVAVNGTDVGSFASLSAPCVNGEAEFTYTAPANLQGRSDSFVFTFYHDSESSPASQGLTMQMSPSGNQLVLANYSLIMSGADGNLSMNIESGKTFTVTVVDDKGNTLTQNATYTITNEYTTLGDINDTTGAGATPNLAIVGISANFSITTKKKSGTFPIKVSVAFIDVNGQARTLQATFNVTIFSGPPTAMSISYVSTDQDTVHSQFIEVFSVKLTDKYNNPVNTQPMIHVGAIAGYAKDPTQYPPIKAAVDATRNSIPTVIPANASYATSRLYNGNLLALREDAKVDEDSIDQAIVTIKTNTLGGVSTSYDLTGLDVYNNILVLFGDGYVYHKSGKWDLSSVSGTNQLKVNEKFEGTTPTYDIGFAIGNNYRQDTCRFGEEWVLTTESDDGNYRVDESGYARIKMPYDYYLTGKDVIVYANLVGDVLGATDATLRVGEAKKVTLRGHELTPDPEEGWVIPANISSPGLFFPFKFRMKDTVEWYRNGHVGQITPVISGDGVSCSLTYESDYRNCDSEGVVIVGFTCTNSGTVGSISLEQAPVGTELKY
ncbi:MAG: hypothetical protein JXK05_09350 [Campylobacterales bacterium]|nr:hypothetical protein [Campylobacterales bacterium]